MERGYSDYQKDLREYDRKKIDFPIFGLVNPARSYNWFLNSIIQSFWLIDSFRSFFIWYSSLYYTQDDKFITELKCFFNEIMRTPKNEFDNAMKIFYLKDLRDELAMLEGYESKFKIGDMCDATELYDIILTKVQENLCLSPKGTISYSGTILQEIIGLNIKTKCECPWGKTFDLPQNKDQYLIYVSAFKIWEQVGVNRKDTVEDILEKSEKYHQKLGNAVKSELEKSIVFPDDDHYKSWSRSDQAVYKMSTSREPEVLSIDLKWSEYEPLDVLTWFNLIPNSLYLSNIYDLEGQDDCLYMLKGMIIYWGAHYYSFFRVFIDGEEEWLRVDDRTITKKGAWKDIVTECVNAMVTPTIILFEKYRESVLVPEIKSLDRKFALSRLFLRDLIEETKKNKRKANYDDWKFEVVHQDSTPLNEVSNASNFSEANNSNAEKRDDEDNDNEKKEDKNEAPVKDNDSKVDEKVEPIQTPIGEDDWICDGCQTINKIDNYKCKKWFVKNEVIEMLISGKEQAERYSKKCYRWDEVYNSLIDFSWPKCKKKSYNY